MKIKAEMTIAIGQFENIKPIIEIDTEHYDEAQHLVRVLHEQFHNLVDDNEIRKHQTEIFRRIRNKEPIDIRDWQAYVEPYPQVAYQANEIKKEVKRIDYKLKKDEKKSNTN